ncbi:MAG TPA: response regulator [bacterium]|nr:response regulator [bacterium]
MDKVYTTVEVAELIHVTQKAVMKWCDNGKLDFYKTPGGHRRITAVALHAFLMKYKMPVPAALESRGKKRVLIVDDEEAVLSVITRAILKHDKGLEIKTATDGFEAGAAFSDFKPDLVILDFKLPGINGIEVCKAIRRKDKYVRIIAITGYCSSENKREMLNAGADDFMPKPLDMKKLMETVGEFLSDK